MPLKSFLITFSTWKLLCRPHPLPSIPPKQTRTAVPAVAFTCTAETQSLTAGQAGNLGLQFLFVLFRASPLPFSNLPRRPPMRLGRRLEEHALTAPGGSDFPRRLSFIYFSDYVLTSGFSCSFFSNIYSGPLLPLESVVGALYTPRSLF